MKEVPSGFTATRSRFDAQLSRRDFERFSKLVYEQCGIRLPQHKRSMLEARLRKRLREHNLVSFEEYAEMIFDGEIPVDELVKLIDVVTTNKTDFFREPAHFAFLVERALPVLLADGRGGFSVMVSMSGPPFASISPLAAPGVGVSMYP